MPHDASTPETARVTRCESRDEREPSSGRDPAAELEPDVRAALLTDEVEASGAASLERGFETVPGAARSARAQSSSIDAAEAQESVATSRHFIAPVAASMATYVLLNVAGSYVDFASASSDFVRWLELAVAHPGRVAIAAGLVVGALQPRRATRS